MQNAKKNVCVPSALASRAPGYTEASLIQHGAQNAGTGQDPGGECAKACTQQLFKTFTFVE